MSSDDIMDWSNSPTSWAAVFEGEAELPVPALSTRSPLKDGKDASASPSQIAQVASGSQPEPLRYLPSPFINKFNCLETIDESVDAEAEVVDEEIKSDDQDQHTDMKRSASCSALVTRTQAQAISIPANKHVVVASVPMQYATSLPNMVVTYSLPDDSLEPRWQRLGFSPTTGVAIRLKLDIPELLRPYEKPPPMTIAQIEKMPLWAQPPVDDCLMRADWAHVHVNYRARVEREFGQDIFIQYPGWWQEVIKGSQGRIAVKSDDHYYTVYCYLPGHTSDDVCIYQAKQAIGIQSDSYQRNEHFHWKIALPQAEFKHITTRMNGTTLTVQIFKQKFLDSFAYDFEPRTALIAGVDMIPKEIYGL